MCPLSDLAPLTSAPIDPGVCKRRFMEVAVSGLFEKSGGIQKSAAMLAAKSPASGAIGGSCNEIEQLQAIALPIGFESIDTSVVNEVN